MGLKVTVLRESDKDTDGNVKSNKVDVTTDKDGIKSMIKVSLMVTTPWSARQMR